MAAAMSFFMMISFPGDAGRCSIRGRMIQPRPRIIEFQTYTFQLRKCCSVGPAESAGAFRKVQEIASQVEM
jgi:hypothetical protein